ncbi:unnamed protein product [Meloidogyne enterolobii]|uniref:Uncharacterized protein n=1 Tax=Meloidogyne enterolobii TaxID=390850 RepID=A0ACB0Y229_MELEN
MKKFSSKIGLRYFRFEKKVLYKDNFKICTIKALLFSSFYTSRQISSSKQILQTTLSLQTTKHQGVMLFWFDDGSGTKKAPSTTPRSATTILPMFFASTLFVFVLVGQVNSESGDDRIGFFKHTLKDGHVTLADYSEAVGAGDDSLLVKYTNRSESCDVKINEGSIVLYYKRENGKNIKNNGCAVDLFTSHSNKIKFKAGVKNKTADCLKKCSSATNTFDGASDNTLPFAYSYSTTKENITQFKKRRLNGTCRRLDRCGGDERLCMPWTSLEVAWNKCFIDDDDDSYYIFAHTHPSKTK